MSDPTNSTLSFVNPATQTPLFVAEWITCAYPVSDLYASSPRYLYYALLILVFLSQRHAWLTNVFLGVLGTYAGIASIEAFILINYNKPDPVPQNLSIPFIQPSSVAGNDTLNSIPNLIAGRNSVEISPSALEFDIDALLAITVTGYLMMLPIHCWSSSIRASRARHLLVLLWNILMFAGMISSILMWPTLFNDPLQYRFCYPTILDGNSTTSNGHYEPDLWQGDWNDTVWNIFSNFTIGTNLDSNCFYPCFNTSQILRRASSLVADTGSHKSPRIHAQLSSAGLAAAGEENKYWKESKLASLMYVAIIVTTVMMLFLLAFVLSPMRRLTRVPVNRPKELFSNPRRKKLFPILWKEFKHGLRHTVHLVRRPRTVFRWFRSTTTTDEKSRKRKPVQKFLRFWFDVLALVTLFVAMVLTPATIVVFIIFIEWYIHRDLVSSEAPQQVGQWSTYVGVALVLLSAVVLRFRYSMASVSELRDEIEETKIHLEKLEQLLEKKEHKHAVQEQKRRTKTESSTTSSSEMELRRITQRTDTTTSHTGLDNKSNC